MQNTSENGAATAAKRDQFTFQFAELDNGNAPALAFAKVASDFLQSYRGTKYYESILSGLLRTLVADSSVSEEARKVLEKSLSQRVNALLEVERAKDAVKQKGRKPVYQLREDSEEDDYDDEEDEEALKARLAEEERKKQEYEEQVRRDEEREAEKERQRIANEEALRARARQVDSRSLEEKLQGMNITVLNTGGANKKAGDKKKGSSEEDIKELQINLAKTTSEKDRLQRVLNTSDHDLPAELEAARKELADVQSGGGGSQLETAQASTGKTEKQLSAQVAELKQKITKQTTVRNRLALQMKAAANPSHTEILSLLEKKDTILFERQYGV